MSEHRNSLDEIAAFLIEKETITGKEFMKIFREVKGIPEPEEGEEKVKAQRIGFAGEVPETLAKTKTEENVVEDQKETLSEMETPEVFSQLSDVKQPEDVKHPAEYLENNKYTD